MAIQTVRAQINGSWHTLTYNSSTGAWEATVTAPSVTSYTQANHYYNVTVDATNTAGTSATADASDLDGLKLYVREVTAPTAAIISPTSGAYVTNNQQPVIFTATDTGSGVDPASLVVRLGGTVVPSSAITREAITDGYRFTYTPQAAMSDGTHTVTVDISDFDGNAAVQQTTTFTVDTVDPALNVTTPSDGFITNTAALTVTGTTNDATSSPVTVTVPQSAEQIHSRDARWPRGATPLSLPQRTAQDAPPALPGPSRWIPRPLSSCRQPLRRIPLTWVRRF